MTDDTQKRPMKSLGRKSIQLSTQPQELMTQKPALARAWTAQVITLFPGAFPGLLGDSLTGKALKDGIWQLQTTDLRRFGEGKHRNVDDTPAGGGAGMVLRADVVGNAIADTRRRAKGRMPLIYLSPRGVPFSQKMAQDLAGQDGVTLLCGRFEGVDQRVLDHFEVIEVSMGDYVLTGGELPAMALIDACVRLLPGVLGNAESAVEESHSNGLLEHPQYTRPATWEGMTIPEVLTSGDHGKVASWRREMSETLTRARRPDMLAGSTLPADHPVARIADATGFAAYAQKVLGSDANAPAPTTFPDADRILEALLACIIDSEKGGEPLKLPSNPWTAAAYLLWLGDEGYE